VQCIVVLSALWVEGDPAPMSVDGVSTSIHQNLSIPTRSARQLRYGLRAAQRHASGAPLAGSIDGTDVWHATALKNAPDLRPRQRRHLRADVGRRVGRALCVFI
jgi:hypothetical protein